TVSTPPPPCSWLHTASAFAITLSLHDALPIFTGEAVRQAKQSIRKARRENPHARIIVTGCAAQTDPAAFVAMEEVDLVLGNEEKLQRHNYRALPDFGVNDFEKARVNDIFSVRETASHMVDAIE